MHLGRHDKTEEKFWHVWRKKSLLNWEKLNTQQKHNIWKSWEILFTNPIFRYLDIEIIYWKLTCSNVSISNPPLSSRKSFPHFYFTPNYPASPPPIPQLLTPDHFLASQNMSGKFTIYLSFKFDKTLSKKKTIFFQMVDNSHPSPFWECGPDFSKFFDCLNLVM